MSAVERIKSAVNAIKPTDGPGHTDHPRVDIEAHRRNAKYIKYIGYCWLAIAVYAASSAQLVHIATAFGIFVMAQLGSFGMRMQALEWEVQLDDE